VKVGKKEADEEVVMEANVTPEARATRFKAGFLSGRILLLLRMVRLRVLGGEMSA
jgi:hypothetical protein